MSYLEDHPPVRSQYRCPRRSTPSGVVVVHTAENTPDFVAFDGGAEAVANFIRTRDTPGSYHDLADSDSVINLVSYWCEAFHDGTGSNPHSYGVSAATRADVWPFAPQAWRDGCIWNMAGAAARYARWLRAERGIVIPASRITRAESELHIPGFISHAERDPTRRTDPGKDFPWSQFLSNYAEHLAGGVVTPNPTIQEHDLMDTIGATATRPWVATSDNGTVIMFAPREDHPVVVAQRKPGDVWAPSSEFYSGVKAGILTHRGTVKDPIPFRVVTDTEFDQALALVRRARR